MRRCQEPLTVRRPPRRHHRASSLGSGGTATAVVQATCDICHMEPQTLEITIENDHDRVILCTCPDCAQDIADRREYQLMRGAELLLV